jgi:hypothetical protein
MMWSIVMGGGLGAWTPFIVVFRPDAQAFYVTKSPLGVEARAPMVPGGFSWVAVIVSVGSFLSVVRKQLLCNPTTVG